MNKHEIDSALKRIAQGDNDAFESLYLETRRGVYAFLFSYFDSAFDAEDAMQTVYLKIKQNIAKYKGGNGLAWILQIAKNTALNDLRAKTNYKRRQEPIDEETVDAAYSDDFELKDTLLSVMKRTLSEEEQQIVILHVVWGYRHKEIAKIMNLPLGTVTSKYKRAADKLQTAWKEEQL